MLEALHYEHVMREAQPPQPVPPDQQRRALQALLATLAPETLTPSERLLALMSPRPPGYDANSGSFLGRHGSSL